MNQHHQKDFNKGDGMQYNHSQSEEFDSYDGISTTKNAFGIYPPTPQILLTSGTFEGTTSAEESDGLHDKRLITHKYSDEGESDKDDDDDGIVVVDDQGGMRRDDDHRSDRRSSSRVETFDCRLFSSRKDYLSHILYITTFAIIGTICRIYIGRFFGLDCIWKEQQDGQDDGSMDTSRNDFLTPLSSQICLTSDGKTQRGGAIFIDLPANMLGSYVIELLKLLSYPPLVTPPTHFFVHFLCILNAALYSDC
jgi:hypothetical protein